MYREVYDYAVKNSLVSVPNTALKLISAYINLDENGEYLGLDIIEKKMRKKVLCPDTGSLAFAGGNSNPIVEKCSFIFDKKQKKHEGWMAIMKDGADNTAIMKAIYCFSVRCEEDEKFSNQIYSMLIDGKVKSADFVSFRVNGIKAEEDGSWHDWLGKYIIQQSKNGTEESFQIVSSITGRIVTSIPKKTAPSVKTSVTGTGAYVAAIGSCPSFESYGLEGNIGASIGQEEAETIKAGLEYLLNGYTHYNGKFNLIHWFENEGVEDLINESLSLNDDDDTSEENDEADKSLSKLMKCALTGEVPDRMIPETKYYISRFIVPAKGREYLSDGYIGSYKSLFDNLVKWYEDTKLYVRLYNKDIKKKWLLTQKSLRNIYGVLFELMSDADKNSKDKYKKLDATFGTSKYELLKSIYSGEQIPRILFQRAIDLFDKNIVSGKNPNVKLLQIIQVYLKRMKEENMKEYSETRAYACGRLFAVYERLQNLASGQLNVNVTQKYFSAVQKAPQVIFPKLANLSIVHMKKIKNSGTKIWLDKKIGEIAAQIGETFPVKFTDVEKGQFILGYYNQKNELYVSDSEK